MSYTVALTVDPKALPILLGVIEGYKGIVLVGMTLNGEAKAAAESVNRKGYVGGKRDKGIRGDDLLVELLSNGKMKLSVIQRQFASRGFALTSASPILSKLIAAKKVMRVGSSEYRLADK